MGTSGNCIYVDKIGRVWLAETNLKTDIFLIKELHSLKDSLRYVINDEKEIIVFRDSGMGWSKIPQKSMKVLDISGEQETEAP